MFKVQRITSKLSFKEKIQANIVMSFALKEAYLKLKVNYPSISKSITLQHPSLPAKGSVR